MIITPLWIAHCSAEAEMRTGYGVYRHSSCIRVYFPKMIKNKHPTTDQLLAYSTGSLKDEEEYETGSPFLLCDQFLKLMPLPTIERFWQVSMEEREAPEPLAE